jgi:hypothetical protein
MIAMDTPLTDEQLAEIRRKNAAKARAAKAKKRAAEKAAAERRERRELEDDLEHARLWADSLAAEYSALSDFTTIQAVEKCSQVLRALGKVRALERQLEL